MTTRYVANAVFLANFLLITASSNVGFAQLPEIGDGQLGVDCVRTTDNIRLYGFVLSQHADGRIEMAIERAWLANTWPELAQRFTQDESAQIDERKQLLITRIERWIAERQAESDLPLRSFLESQLAQIRDEKPKSATSVFCLVQLAVNEYAKVTLAKPKQRQIAGLAYQHGLDNVVTTSAGRLSRQLADIKVDPNRELVNLTGHLPQFLSESDRQWAARQALIEFDRGERVELHGKGNMLLRTGQKVNPLALMQQMLSGGGDPISQLGAELGLPEFQRPQRSDDTWRREAARIGDAERVRGVLVYRLDQKLLSSEVGVDCHFLARDADGKWFEFYRHHVVVNENDTKIDQIDAIQNDPQFQQIRDMLGGLGIVDNDTLNRALRQGAATRQAMNQAANSLAEFAGRYSNDLATPPIALPAEAGK